MFNYQSPPPFSPPPDSGIGAPVPPAPAGMPPGAGGMPPAPYPLPMGPPDPASIKYLTETQQDGSVLLRMVNPNGSPGPVVKIVPAPGAKKGK